MRTTTIGLSTLLALGLALLASRRVRFLAAVLATALVGVTLSSCIPVLVPVPIPSPLEACFSYKSTDSDEEGREYKSRKLCAGLGRGEKRLKEIDKKSGACLSYHRKFWEAPSGSDKEIRYNALWWACLEGGENLAEEIQETEACLSYHRKFWDASENSDEERRQLNLLENCLREKNPAREQETVAPTFALETVIINMAANLKQKLGEDAEPALVIVPIESRVGEDIDTQLINESIRILVSDLRFFKVSSRNVKKILQKIQQPQSGVVDSDTATEIGRIVGVQYVLHGTVAGDRTNCRVFLTLIELETQGSNFFEKAAQVRK